MNGTIPTTPQPGDVRIGNRFFYRVGDAPKQRTFDFEPKQAESTDLLDFVMCPECEVVDTRDGWEFDDLRELDEDAIEELSAATQIYNHRRFGWIEVPNDAKFNPAKPLRWHCLACGTMIDLAVDEQLPTPELINQGVE